MSRVIDENFKGNSFYSILQTYETYAFHKFVVSDLSGVLRRQLAAVNGNAIPAFTRQ